MDSATKKKIGVFTCSAIVAGNMMGSGIALLPANLAHIGSITVLSWLLASIGALGLAYVFARLGTVDPEAGGPVAYAEQVAPILGYQTSVLYFNANWIGNLAIAITGVAYLSVFFHQLTDPVVAGVVTIAIVWFFAGLNILGAQWVGRLVTVGVLLLLIPVVLTATVGWFYFKPAVFMANWNVGHQSDFHAVGAGILLCIWSFIGVESATVNAGLVENPKRTIPIATLIGSAVAALVYTASCTAMEGMVPADKIAHSGAPFSMINATMFGHWAGPIVSAFAAFACLASLGSWMMMVAQAGARGARDGMLPKVYAAVDKRDIPVKGLLINALMMSVLMVVLMFLSGSAQQLFGYIVSIAVMLTVLPYFYSALRLLHIAELRYKSAFQVVACLIAIIFCFSAFSGAHDAILAAALIVSLVCMIFYERKDRSKLEQSVYEKFYHWHITRKHT